MSSRPRLLIVDDERSVGEMLSYAARQYGYQTRIAGDAAEFRREYDAAPPEAVLLDLALGQGDGVELLRFLAERNSAARVLIVSGSDRRIVEAADRFGRVLGLRMGGFLTKPVLVQDLIDALRAA